MDKKAQFFGLYLVFITLFLCGVVISLYHVQQKNALNSLVSRRAVLEVQDGLELFEMREVSLIKDSYEVYHAAATNLIFLWIASVIIITNAMLGIALNGVTIV